MVMGHLTKRYGVLLLFWCCIYGIVSIGAGNMAGMTGMTMKDEMGRNLMGVLTPDCDDLTDPQRFDWDGSKDDYQCQSSKLLIDKTTEPDQNCTPKENLQMPGHVCLIGKDASKLVYDTNIPTHGDHRPNWPAYGSYLYMPQQRWVHSLEHGGLVFLYHPCAESSEVEKFKTTVRNCLFRHVITPDKNVPPERPFVLVAWGCKIMMGYYDKTVVQDFIKENAIHDGLEQLSKNGSFVGETYRDLVPPGIKTLQGLLQKEAETPPGADDNEDRVLCPNS